MQYMDKSLAFGKRFYYIDRCMWELVGQDKDNVPLFSRVIGGKTQKEEYFLPNGEIIAQQLMGGF